MPIEIDVKQGEAEWFALRCGNLGASSVSRIITSKGEPSKQRQVYLYELASELITGKSEDSYKSKYMENGLLGEPESRALFEMVMELDVRQIGLVYKDEQRKCHCSPDGLINNNAGLELKNPKSSTQVKYLLSSKLPVEYFSQIQMSLYVCEREHWWVMSNYVGLAPLILKVQRNDPFIARLEKELNSFVEELAFTVKQLRSLG